MWWIGSVVAAAVGVFALYRTRKTLWRWVWGLVIALAAAHLALVAYQKFVQKGA